MEAREVVGAITALDGVDREIAELMHLDDYAEHGPTAVRAYHRALEKPSYGRYRALDREVMRSDEAEEFLMLALAVMN